MYAPRDHPIPAVTIICDFCRAPDPAWEFPARDTTLLGVTECFGPWCACDACRELVDADDRDGLARRARENAPEVGLPLAAWRTIQEAFFEAKAGGARPIRVTPLHGRNFIGPRR